jgi:hypothetical protein
MKMRKEKDLIIKIFINELEIIENKEEEKRKSRKKFATKNDEGYRYIFLLNIYIYSSYCDVTAANIL